MFSLEFSFDFSSFFLATKLLIKERAECVRERERELEWRGGTDRLNLKNCVDIIHVR